MDGIIRYHPVHAESATNFSAETTELEKLQQENDRLIKCIHDFKAEAAAKAFAEAKAAKCIRDLESEASVRTAASEDLRREVVHLQSCIRELEESTQKVRVNYLAAQRVNFDLTKVAEEITQKKTAQCNRLERAVDNFLNIAIQKASIAVTSANSEYLTRASTGHACSKEGRRQRHPKAEGQDSKCIC